MTSMSLEFLWQVFLLVSIFWIFQCIQSSISFVCFSRFWTLLQRPPYSLTRSSKVFCLTKSSSFLSVSALILSVISLMAERSILILSSPISGPDIMLAILLLDSSCLSLSLWSSSSARSKINKFQVNEQKFQSVIQFYLRFSCLFLCAICYFSTALRRLSELPMNSLSFAKSSYNAYYAF